MVASQQVSGITLPVTNVRQAAWAEYKQSPRLIAGTVLATVVALALFSTMSEGGFKLAIFVVALFWAFCILPLVKKIRSRMVEQFATANGFSYSPSANLSAKDGSVFAHSGHSENFEDFVAGKFRNAPFQFLHYTYTVGSGKHSRTYHRSILVMEFKSNLPHVVVDSKKITSISFPYAKGQLLELESNDFAKYFRLYVPKEYEVEALSILTPDVMAQLIDKSSLYDVEFINNHVYIYAGGLVDTRAKLQALFELAGTIVDELGGKLDRFKIDTVARAVEPKLQGGFGSRLVTSDKVFLVLIILVVLGTLTTLALVWASG